MSHTLSPKTASGAPLFDLKPGSGQPISRCDETAPAGEGQIQPHITCCTWITCVATAQLRTRAVGRQRDVTPGCRASEPQPRWACTPPVGNGRLRCDLRSSPG